MTVMVNTCSEVSPGEVEAAGEGKQLEKPCSPQAASAQQQQRPPGPVVSSGLEAEAEDDEDASDACKQKAELTSLGGRINATHRKICRAAGTAPRMVSDAIRDDLFDAINEFVRKVCG